MTDYKQLKAEERQKMKDAIERLKQEDPKRFAELLKRAHDKEYDEQQYLEARAKEAAEHVERALLAEIERARRFTSPVITGLPDIDMSRVKGMVAFRVWNYDRFGLKSTARGYHWREVNFADRVPERHNQSGFYCIKLTGLGVLTTGAGYFGTGRQNVSGFVELLGRVEEHTDGVLRVEVAKLICLFVTTESIEAFPDIVRSLYELYPVTPVFVLNPEQLADVLMREVLRQRYLRGQE